jgi:hypothetical protein
MWHNMRVANHLTEDQRAALRALVPDDQRTGDLREDLVAAAKEVMERRRTNTRLGGAVLGALREQGLSWRQIDKLTGIPWSTARRWHEAIPGTEQQPEDTPPAADSSD